jgi:Putative DNA-binding domain
MLALREVQKALMGALVLRDDDVAAASLLRCGAGPDAHRRLQIYRNNLFETRIAALTAVYPVVARLVGRAFFRSAARAYIQIFPSRSGDLHAFGDRWPEFLGEYVPAARLPYLEDVAALEWAYHHAYHEEQLPAIDPVHLAQVPAADQTELRLRIQPSAHVVRSPYPILRIWQSNQPPAAESESLISLDEGGVDVLVVQRDLEIEFRRLDAAESRWLCALGDGSSLAVATTQALEFDNGFDLAAALVRHLATGLFVGVFLADCDQ